jgi:hypothetical protein
LALVYTVITGGEMMSEEQEKRENEENKRENKVLKVERHRRG